MRLGSSELYDPRSPDNSARVEAQIIYFQMALGKDDRLSKRLKGEVYATFVEAFTADERTGPIFAWNVVAASSFGWDLIKTFEGCLDETTDRGSLFRQRRRELAGLRILLLNLYRTTALERMGAWTLPLCVSLLIDQKMDEERDGGAARTFGDSYRYKRSRAQFEPPVPSPTFYLLGHLQYWRYLLGKSFYEYQHEDEINNTGWVAPAHWEGDASWRDPSRYPHGYLPEYETRREAKERISHAFNKWLDAYLDEAEASLLQRGRENTKVKRSRGGGNPLDHFEWLYCYQVEGWTYERIALHFGEDKGRSLTAPAVSEAIRELADLIGIVKLRP